LLLHLLHLHAALQDRRVLKGLLGEHHLQAAPTHQQLLLLRMPSSSPLPKARQPELSGGSSTTNTGRATQL